MDRKSVNYIKAIAEMRSISAAAESLGISQPALSSHLKKIESEVGAVLFDRGRQPLELTEAGHAYLDYLDQAQSLEKELEQTLADIEGLETGSVTVGGAAFFNVAYLPGAVGIFVKEFPGVDVDVVDGNVPFLTAEALKGRIDLFITPVADDPDRFVYEKLLDEKVYLAVPAEWEINNELSAPENGETVAKITADEFRSLCGCPFILLREEQHIGRMMESLFDRFECRPKKIVRAEQTLTSLALTMAGVGVSLITESSIRTSGLSRFPRLYLADEELCTRSMYVAYPRNKYLSKAASEFIRTLREANAKAVAAKAASTLSHRDFAPSIVENLARNAVKNPDKLCLADAGRSVTYKEAWDGICGLAMELDRRGVTKGSCVVIECNQSVDYMLWVLAIQLLGAISVPLEKNAAAGRIIEIAGETKAVLHIGAKETEGLGIPHVDIKDAAAFALGQIINGVYRGSLGIAVDRGSGQFTVIFEQNPDTASSALVSYTHTANGYEYTFTPGSGIYYVPYATTEPFNSNYTVKWTSTANP
ncbi:MAG: LysR substrate-binding domain-containing protein, partial [Bacillota bacterium]